MNGNTFWKHWKETLILHYTGALLGQLPGLRILKIFNDDGYLV